jgi:phosphoribosylformimino-5-aminoimidazole carboxamide ribotide isomerase
MIEIIPAIDVIEGKCVRLSQGNYQAKKTYFDSPLEVALRFEDAGLKRMHLVDLDGAKAGRVINYNVLEKIASKTSLSVDFGGGLRAENDLKIAFECGAKQVNLGSVAVKEKNRCKEWVKTYGPEKIILSADVKDERVHVAGWEEDSKIYLFDLLHEYREQGIVYVTCTDISCDGMLTGPSVELYKKIQGEVEGIKLIASGGVKDMADVEALMSLGVYGVIIGKAIYEGHISLGDLSSYVK